MPVPREHRLVLVLVALACLLFAPSLANGFALDDVAIVQAHGADGRPNPMVAEWHAPWWYLGQRHTATIAKPSIEYRPLVSLSYALAYQLLGRPLGAEAAAQHLVDILLHGLAVWLVWRWLRGLGAGPRVALGAAGAFALCGIHSEAVLAVVGRADQLVVVLGLVALHLFDRGRTRAAGVVFFLAFLSKETALALAPFLACHLLAKAWLAGEPATLGGLLRTRGKAMATALLPGLVAYFALRQFALADVGAYVPAYEQNPLAHVDATARMVTATVLMGLGLAKTVAPLGLSSGYGPGALPLFPSPAAPAFLATLAVLGGGLGFALVWRRRQPLLFLAATAFLGLLFIGSNLPVAIGTHFAERLYYAPSLGVCILAGLLLQRAPRAALPLLLALGAWHGSVVVQRTLAWRDSATLFATDADRMPQAADLQARAGYQLMASDPARARAYFERAIAADPEHSGAFGNLAALQAQAGDLQGAEANLRRALATRYVRHSGTQAQLQEGLLRVLRGLGKMDAARTFAQEILAGSPGHYFARLVLLDLAHGAVAADAYERMLQDALRIHAGDPRFELRALTFPCELGRMPADLAAFAARLQALLQALPPGERREPAGLVAVLCLGEALLDLGRAADARRLLEDLLREPSLAPAVRRRAEQAAQRAK